MINSSPSHTPLYML